MRVEENESGLVVAYRVFRIRGFVIVGGSCDLDLFGCSLTILFVHANPKPRSRFGFDGSACLFVRRLACLVRPAYQFTVLFHNFYYSSPHHLVLRISASGTNLRFQIILLHTLHVSVSIHICRHSFGGA